MFKIPGHEIEFKVYRKQKPKKLQNKIMNGNFPNCGKRKKKSKLYLKVCIIWSCTHSFPYKYNLL